MGNRWKIGLLVLLVFFIANVSAMSVDFVEVDSLSPGGEGRVRIGIENVFDEDVEDISLRLVFKDLPFTPVGTSEHSLDVLENDEDETFTFRVRVARDIVPGDYEIPYVLEYNLDNEVKIREGGIGVRVSADPELDFSVETTTPVLGRQGEITLKIVNKGFSDAGFVSLRVLPDGFTLLSDREAYIGEIDSDDFETESFDVIFTNVNANFVAVVEYRDFDNNVKTENVRVPLTVYTQEKAVELGIIQESKVSSYVVLIIVLIVVIFVWRRIKKRKRLRKNMRKES